MYICIIYVHIYTLSVSKCLILTKNNEWSLLANLSPIIITAAPIDYQLLESLTLSSFYTIGSSPLDTRNTFPFVILILRNPEKPWSYNFGCPNQKCLLCSTRWQSCIRTEKKNRGVVIVFWIWKYAILVFSAIKKLTNMQVGLVKNAVGVLYKLIRVFCKNKKANNWKCLN